MNSSACGASCNSWPVYGSPMFTLVLCTCPKRPCVMSDLGLAPRLQECAYSCAKGRTIKAERRHLAQVCVLASIY